MPHQADQQIRGIDPAIVDMADLFNGETVSITFKQPIPWGPSSQTFVVPRALICGYSEYFDRAFNGRFAEHDSKEITLTDVDPWVGRTFIGWLYTQQLKIHLDEKDKRPDMLLKDRFFYVLKGVSNDVSEFSGAGRGIFDTEDDDVCDAVTWEWNVLFTLYVFGDRYCSTLFRQTVFEKIQTRALQTFPLKYSWFSVMDIADMSRNLPRGNNLRRFITQLFVEEPTRICIDEMRDLDRLPQDFLAEYAWRMRLRHAALACNKCCHFRSGVVGEEVCEACSHTREDAVDLRKRDWCELHEHKTDEEKAECTARRAVMDWRFQEV